MVKFTSKDVVQILSKKKGRELIMSAPLHLFKTWATKLNAESNKLSPHIVTIMNNSLQISVLSQLTVLTLFNDTCADCGKTFTHYIVVPKTDTSGKTMIYNGKPLYQLNPCSISTNKNGKVIYNIFTKDHIIPKSKFGANSLPNYQLMCQSCNGDKSNSVTDDDYKYGQYMNGIFQMNINNIKKAYFGNAEYIIKNIERHRGGLFYIEFTNPEHDGYYLPSGKNCLNSNLRITKVLDN